NFMTVHSGQWPPSPCGRVVLLRGDGGGGGQGLARDGQKNREGAAFSGMTFDLQPALMAIGDVLDDGETQTRAALFAAPLHVDAIEALSQTRDRFGRDALAVVAHAGRNDPVGVAAR